MRSRRGMTLIELLVVVAILAMLIAILLPALASTRAAARRQICLTHTRTQAIAFLNYAQDFQSQLPRASPQPYGPGSWPELCTLPASTAEALDHYGLSDGPPASNAPDLQANHRAQTAWKCPTAQFEGMVPRLHRRLENLFFIDQYYVLTGLENNPWYHGSGSPTTSEDASAPLTADLLVAPLFDPSNWLGFHGRGTRINDWLPADGINQSYLDGHAQWIPVDSLPQGADRARYTSPTRYVAWKETVTTHKAAADRGRGLNGM